MVRDFIIITTVTVLILLWHPWATVDDEVKESIQAQLVLKEIYLRENWEPLGTKVDVYGVMSNESKESYIGYFNVDYWGKVYIIHTSYGKLKPDSFEPIIEIEKNNNSEKKNETVYPDKPLLKVGQSFIMNFSISPDQPVKAWEMKIRYNSSIVWANSMTWGDYFGDMEVFRSPNVEINNDEGFIDKLYELTIRKDNLTEESGVLIYINFTTLRNGSAIVFAEKFRVTNGISYIPIQLTNPIQTRVII